MSLSGSICTESATDSPANRCIACRQSKIKCSGDEPCSNCRRRSVNCQFSETNHKVLVSEKFVWSTPLILRVQLTAGIRYLRDLQKQAYHWQRVSGTKRSRDVAFPPEDDLDDGNILNDLGGAADLLCPRPTESPADTEATSVCNIWTSPFTLPTTVMKDADKRQRKWSELVSSFSVAALYSNPASIKSGLPRPRRGLSPHD